MASCLDEPVRRRLSERCASNDDCQSNLVCSLGRCHLECEKTADCSGDGRCVQSATANVCQLEVEANCIYDSDCHEPLVCAADQECRNECQTGRDCLERQVCAKSGVCAETSEVDASGELVDAPGGGGAGGAAGNTSTNGTAGTTGGAESAGATGGTGGTGEVAEGGTGGQVESGGAAGTGESMAGAAGEASVPCGQSAQACCDGACTASFTTCVNEVCEACGSLNEACCEDDACAQNLSCVAGTCSCGGGGEPCCNGTACDGESACVNGICECGKPGAPCCAADTCSNSYACTGEACSCLLTCAGNYPMFLRSDGSVWVNDDDTTAAPTAIPANGAMLTGLTQLAVGGSVACGLHADTTAWCFLLGGSTNDNGQLGNGTTATGTSGATQVVASASGASFSGISQLAIGYNFGCALTQTGRVRCWGEGNYGALGTGARDDSPVPVEVIDAQGAALSGVAEIAAGSFHACARKTDGTLWCWGYNENGQLGVGSSDQRRTLPAQVNALGTTVIQIRAGESNTCAIVEDRSVWCWGHGEWGQLGTGQLSESSFPVQVQTAQGGPALADVAVVAVADSYGPLALKTDGSLWGWGASSTSGYAELIPDPGGAETAVWRLSSSACYIRKDGTAVTRYMAPTCP